VTLSQNGLPMPTAHCLRAYKSYVFNFLNAVCFFSPYPCYKCSCNANATKQISHSVLQEVKIIIKGDYKCNGLDGNIVIIFKTYLFLRRKELFDIK